MSRREPQDRQHPFGHATVAFTLDTYTDDVPELHHAAAEIVSGLFLDNDRETSGEDMILFCTALATELVVISRHGLVPASRSGCPLGAS